MQNNLKIDETLDYSLSAFNLSKPVNTMANQVIKMHNNKNKLYVSSHLFESHDID